MFQLSQPLKLHDVSSFRRPCGLTRMCVDKRPVEQQDSSRRVSGTMLSLFNWTAKNETKMTGLTLISSSTRGSSKETAAAQFFGFFSERFLHFLRIESDLVVPSTCQRLRSVPSGQLVRRMMRHANPCWFCAAVSFEDPLVYGTQRFFRNFLVSPERSCILTIPNLDFFLDREGIKNNNNFSGSF